jgi:hypothetical protein
MFDQNALPRHSMGEDWGKNNYAKGMGCNERFSDASFRYINY